jgi:drug/metabolite transporter (DMT)-like permease
MNTFGLYAVAVLIWGTTWLAITFQLGSVPPEVSVAYRFGIAGLILLAWCLARRHRLAYSWREHRGMAAQGALLIGVNYICVYRAESLIASGLVAVTFSLLSPFNMLGARVCFGTPIRPIALAGAVLGVAGVAAVFLPEIRRASEQGHLVLGLGLALLAVISACFGNLVAARNQRRGLPVVQLNTFGMLYGAAFVAIFALLIGRPFVVEHSAPYFLSLGYLALFGSVLAFGAYLTLIGRIGAGSAGYVNAIVPIVALIVSSVFEGFRWHPATWAGIAACLAGNVLVLRRPARPAA